LQQIEFCEVGACLFYA